MSLLTLPQQPTFQQQGLAGYRYPLQTDAFELYRIEVTKGHDSYIISKTIAHTYYILKGTGMFELRGTAQPVNVGDCIEVQPGIEYTYSGTMTMLLMMTPPWYEGNEVRTKPNPAVFPEKEP